MKNALNNPNLWQQKRGELPVNGNPDTDWMQMLSALENRMPVKVPVKKPFRVRSKWWVNAPVIGSSVVVIYAVVQLYVVHYHRQKPQHQHKITIDSIHLQAKDSLVSKDSSKVMAKDSSDTKPQVNIDQHKVTDSIQKRIPVIKRSKPVTDSVRSALQGSPVPHRDSLLTPVNSNPLKTVHDSTKVPVIDNKPIRKDTTGTDKKGPRKKKRRVSVFI